MRKHTYSLAQSRRNRRKISGNYSTVTFPEVRECSAKDPPRSSYEIKNLHSHGNCFWPEQVGFVHTFGDWMPTWWTSENRLTLTGWAGGPRGEQAAEADAQTLMVRSVDVIARTFGQRPEKVQRLLQELYTHNWCADPCARMAYSFVTAGHEDAPHRLAAPVADTLFFAGEATSLDAQNGTVHGALASGMRAACEFKQSLLSPEAEAVALPLYQPQ